MKHKVLNFIIAAVGVVAVIAAWVVGRTEGCAEACRILTDAKECRLTPKAIK